MPITYLFVPGDRPERFATATMSGAGMAVLDLEDAVSVEDKDGARAQIEAALADGAFKACVRINGTDTPWFADDCRLLKLPGVAAIMLPKAERADDIAAVRATCSMQATIVPLIETARGLASAQNIASALGVSTIAFGSVDYQLDLNIEGDGIELLHARSTLVMASRIAGITAPVDGVTLSVKDVKQVYDDATRSRKLGFSGKLCIHPAQVTPVHRAFAPDDKAISWARGLLQAAAETHLGALTYEGQLVDKPIIERAQAILRRSPPQ